MKPIMDARDEDEVKRLLYRKVYYNTFADNPRADKWQPIFEWIIQEIQNNQSLKVTDVYRELKKPQYDNIVKPSYRDPQHGITRIILALMDRKVKIGSDEYVIALTNKDPVSGTTVNTRTQSWFVLSPPGMQAALMSGSITPPTPPPVDSDAPATVDTTAPLIPPSLPPEPVAPPLTLVTPGTVPAGTLTDTERQFSIEMSEIGKQSTQRRWLRLVPTEDKGYIKRKIGKWTDIDLLKLAYTHNLNVLLEGPPGAGKTQACQEVARQLNVAFGNVEMHAGVSMDDLIGKYAPVENAPGEFEWVYGDLPIILQFGGVFLMDEINALPQEMSTKFYGLLDYRRRIVLTEHKSEPIEARRGSFLFVAAYNPGLLGDITPALRDRFDIVLEYGYDEEIEDAIIKNKDVLKIRDTLRPNIGDTASGKPIETELTTRGLTQLENIWKLVKDDDTVLKLFTNKFKKGTERDAVETTLKEWTLSKGA